MLTDFFKALSDGNRLRIVGLLAHRPHSVEELSTCLELGAPTVSHHLAKLASAGLVQGSTSGHYHVYALDLEALRARAQALLSGEELRDLADIDEGLDPFEQKVLETFLDAEGRLKQVPMKRKKFQVILHHALRLFEDEGPWDQKEVNRRLKTISDDTATLRRGFIDHGLLQRDTGGSTYWRA